MNQQPSQPSPAFSLNQRLFIGVWSTGISYYDKSQIEHGDYKRLAFLDYHTLELEWHSDTVPPDLAEEIIADAALIQAKRGHPFQITAGGQTVVLGE